MKCSECGTELNDGVEFCPKCGKKAVIYNMLFDNNKAVMDKIKKIATEFWQKLSLVGKLSTISLFLFIVLGLVAFLADRIFSALIAIVAVAVVVVALLMKRQVIKVSRIWIPLLVVIISFALVIPYFNVFNINLPEIDVQEYDKYNWDEVVLSEILPKPNSQYGEIGLNSEDYLSLYLTETTAIQYREYVESCKAKGFVIDEEKTESSFIAYNDKGYKLSVSYSGNFKEIKIYLYGPMKLESITWSNSEIAKIIPVPKSNIGTIHKDDEQGYAVYIGNTTIADYNEYVSLCEEKGFTVDLSKESKSFSAKNADSYMLSVEYKGCNIIYISIKEPEYDVKIEIECVENWIFSKYDVDFYINEMKKGTIPHGDKESYHVVLSKGTHTISFESTEDNTLDGEIQVVISKEETLKIKISCSSFGVDIELLSGTSDNSSETNKVVITMNKDDFIGLNLEDAEEKFREMGFTKFKYDTIETEEQSKEKIVYDVEITEFIFVTADFNKGDKFESDSTVKLCSYKYKKPEPEFYSTNDRKTAQNGNSGIFSYKNKSGIYDVYWIIDFDAGYVYYFTDKNGEDFCDKVKIVSGTLNDRVTIIWHEDGDTWPWRLHFKYVGVPGTLVVNDHNGFETEFTTTNLENALRIRNTKTVYED